jgi:hypothetical protein
MAPSRPPHRRGTRSPEGLVGGRPRRTPAYPLIALVIVLVVLGTGCGEGPISRQAQADDGLARVVG